MPARLAFLRPLAHLTKLLPVLALVAFLYLLQEQLAGFEMQAVGAALAELAAWQWAAALLLTGCSFVAVGQYDAVVHRVLGTGVRPARARAAGMRAIALSQTVGFASLSGGLVRLRCLPELDLWTISRLSLLVSLSFLGSWAVLAGGLVLFKHGGPTGLILFLLALIVWQVARFRPQAGMPGLSPRVGLSLLAWTAIDTTCAALVLAVLLPAGLFPPMATLLTAYLLALGAGLLSQSPAGLGAFELALLLLLPQIPEAPLLAAVLAYRVIYFLLPAGLALALLIRPARHPEPAALLPATGSGLARALARSPRADWGLAHQGAQVAMSRDQASGWLLRRAGAFLVALGQPLGRPDLAGLADMADTAGLFPALYKCDARTAARARAAGWSVLALSQEAVIPLDRWSLSLPACRNLRRKLRQMQDGGLRIESDPRSLPLADMARVSRCWSLRNRGEKGFSMGRFDAELLRRQAVVLGYLGDRLVAFASFHTGRTEWSLDLMRQDDTAPAGTMHALIAAGIAAAAAGGNMQVSLAAVPQFRGWLATVADRLPGVSGLRQFKRSFGPDWRPLYLCAPTPLALARAGVSIALAVQRPRLAGLGPRRAAETGPAAFDRIKPAQASSANGQARVGTAPGRPMAGLRSLLARLAGAARRVPSNLLHHVDAHFEIENPGQACDTPRAPSVRAAAAFPADPRLSTGHPDARKRDQRPFPPA